jgi:hypothetical protein
VEHGDADVDEHQDRDDEQRDLDAVHTLSSAQIKPKKKSTKANVPSTARKSAMPPSIRRAASTERKFCGPKR